MFQRALRIFVAISFVSTASFAAPQKATTPAPSQPQKVVITAPTLKKLLLERNLSLVLQMNQVQQAKARVNVARGNILPSINLGTAVASGVSFGLATVTVLLPFLLPSNWFDLRQSQHLLNAQGTAYYIAQLNTYASAYTLYLQVVSDMDLRDALYQQYLNAKTLEDVMKIAMDNGIVSPEDYLKAQAQTQLSYIQVSQVDELLNREKASIREMLALPLTAEIAFERTHAPVSPYENQSPTVLLPQVLKVSPEYTQMNSLIEAAKAAKWSQAFSFLTGSSLTSTKSDGSFSDVTHIGTANLGFGYFPNLTITNLNIAALRIQKQTLEYDHAATLETTLGSLAEAKKQLAAAQKAVDNLQIVYQSQIDRFRMGMISIVDVLQTTNSLTTALANKVQAQANLDAQRVTLHRTMLSDSFTSVQSCKVVQKKKGSLAERIGVATDPYKYMATLDQACKR